MKTGYKTTTYDPKKESANEAENKIQSIVDRKKINNDLNIWLEMTLEAVSSDEPFPSAHSGLFSPLPSLPLFLYPQSYTL